MNNLSHYHSVLIVVIFHLNLASAHHNPILKITLLEYFFLFQKSLKHDDPESEIKIHQQ